MPTPLTIILRNIQYEPNADAVPCQCEYTDAFGTRRFYVNITQTALLARVGTDAWVDSDAAAEVQANVDATWPGAGFVVVLPDPPETP